MLPGNSKSQVAHIGFEQTLQNRTAATLGCVAHTAPTADCGAYVAPKRGCGGGASVTGGRAMLGAIVGEDTAVRLIGVEPILPGCIAHVGHRWTLPGNSLSQVAHIGFEHTLQYRTAATVGCVAHMAATTGPAG